MLEYKPALLEMITAALALWLKAVRNGVGR